MSSIVWTGKEIVAVSKWGTVMTSPDGMTWTAKPAIGVFEPTRMIWTGSQIVAIGERGAVWTSRDGSVWAAPA